MIRQLVFYDCCDLRGCTGIVPVNVSFFPDKQFPHGEFVLTGGIEVGKGVN
ncbi:hypothetical protein ACFLT8_00425 [Chloroflexota bacterium]